MIEALQTIGFSALFFRYVVWIASSLETLDKKWKKVVLGQIIEGFFLLFFFQQLFGSKHIFPIQSIFAQIFGFLLTISGVGLAFVAKQQLGTAWVYAVSFKIVAKQQLVTTGVYASIRHPIYTGIFLSFIGIELLAGSWLWVSMLFLLIPFFLQARKEDMLLQKYFGKIYDRYVAHTKMFIPFVL